MTPPAPARLARFLLAARLEGWPFPQAWALAHERVGSEAFRDPWRGVFARSRQVWRQCYEEDRALDVLTLIVMAAARKIARDGSPALCSPGTREGE
jgi:hypothetical protein